MELLYHYGKIGGTGTLLPADWAKKFNVFCFFVHRTIRVVEFVNVRSPLSCLTSETILMSLDRGSFVVVHLQHSTLSLRCCRHRQKMLKI